MDMTTSEITPSVSIARCECHSLRLKQHRLCYSDESEGQRVKLACAFADERWTTGRSVTDLDWSSKVTNQQDSH